ncbi:2220_t:CDS:2 [Acaulospora colombiana]|uniref:2220_t:CDS:1 n=1 Tax=Acaulospora colombiana TaxID=27376 RepID=A0ACA9KXM7_9GLOM|nr:2220_t:CDS:2 [Acaulospora colombiana]
MPVAFETSVTDSTSFPVGEHSASLTKEVHTDSFLEAPPQRVHELRQTTREEREPLKVQEEPEQKQNSNSFIERTRDPYSLPQEKTLNSEEDVSNAAVNETIEECATITSDTEVDKDLSFEERLLNDNEDYEMVLRAINVLKFQLQQAKEDICKLKFMKERALEDPIQFVEDLRNGTNEKVPKRQFVFGVPKIDWSKYHTNPLEYNARLEKEALDDSKTLEKSRSRPYREESPDLTELVHKKAQELGFKVPLNAVKSTRFRKRTDRNGDNDTIFTNSSKNVDLRSSGPRRKAVGLRPSALMHAASKDSTRFARFDIRLTSFFVYGLSAFFLFNWNTNLCSEDCLNNPSFDSEVAVDKSSNMSSKRNVPYTERHLERFLGKYPGGEAQPNKYKKIVNSLKVRAPKQPPPTLYMPDDDDEVSIKNVMMSVDKVNESQTSQTVMRAAKLTSAKNAWLKEISKMVFNYHHKKSHRFSIITNPIPPHFDADYLPERVGEYNYLGLAPSAP